MKIIKLATVFSLLLMYGCNAQDLKTFESTDEHFNYSGRFEYLQEGGVGLIGSAAYVEFIVEGDVLNIRLQSESAARNYYVLRINDAIHKRSVIKGDTVQTIAVKLPHKGKHTIGIYKATEAFNDKIIFHGIEAKSLMASEKKPFTIEFIGDSITCGALSDASEMPCIWLSDALQMRLRCLSDASQIPLSFSDASQMPLRCLLDASQMPLRFLSHRWVSDASQLPLRCLPDASQFPLF